MKHILNIILFSLLLSANAWGQTGSVSGKIVEAMTDTPVLEVTVTISGELHQSSLVHDGSFLLELPANSNYLLTLSKDGYEDRILNFAVESAKTTDLGVIEMNMVSDMEDFDVPTILLDSEDDSDFASQNIISMLSVSSDVYLSESAFKFGAVRFNVRGFDGEYSHTYINGVNFNDQIRGRYNYSMLGGLNDATRNKDISIYTAPSLFGFGDLGGVTGIETRAASYGRGGKATVSVTNRSYRLRGMATGSTGLMENGFAVTASVGYRRADEGYFEGTFYDSKGFLIAVEKVFGERMQHSISFTALGAPTQRAQSAASYQEIYDLLDNTRYNPNWGYQNGVKRNARVVTSNDPAAVLSHRWQISDKSQLTTGVGVRYNLYGTTALNWYNSADPRPDYYKYLPNYQRESEIKELYASQWKADRTVRQIDWDRMYRVNFDARNNGESARYILEERHSNLLETAFNSTFTHQASNWQTIDMGIEVKLSKGMNYKTVNDLLGGEYWMDKDQFAERDFLGNSDISQNNLNSPNRTVTKGDRFGYDYDIYVNHTDFWLQDRFFFPRADLYYAFKIAYTEFQREGHMKNGRAPENSFGKGMLHTFVNQAVKGGFTFKITGRHFITGNLLYETRAPLPWNAYLSARIKDDAVPELGNERVASVDIGYVVSMPAVKGRVSVFQTNFFDGNEINSFYHDSYRTYINYVLTDVEKVHRGIELGAIVNITQRLKLEAIGTIAEYRYANRPTGYATYENGSKPAVTETVYLKNYYVGGTPQTAASIGLNYAMRGYWYFDVNYNFFDRIYVDLAPIRRTEAATNVSADNMDDLDSKVRGIIEQEKYPEGGTLDASIGKSIRFANGYFLSINFSVSNILNNTSLRTGGYEQGRFDYENYNIDKFPSKYYYAQGRTFFFNLGLRF